MENPKNLALALIIFFTDDLANSHSFKINVLISTNIDIFHVTYPIPTPYIRTLFGNGKISCISG